MQKFISLSFYLLSFFSQIIVVVQYLLIFGKYLLSFFSQIIDVVQDLFIFV